LLQTTVYWGGKDVDVLEGGDPTETKEGGRSRGENYRGGPTSLGREDPSFLQMRGGWIDAVNVQSRKKKRKRESSTPVLARKTDIDIHDIWRREREERGNRTGEVMIKAKGRLIRGE